MCYELPVTFVLLNPALYAKFSALNADIGALSSVVPALHVLGTPYGVSIRGPSFFRACLGDPFPAIFVGHGYMDSQVDSTY